ncbi:hypothetical protein JCM13991_05610 [Thermodesulfovibrio hydrogeniphilus]
MEKVKVTSQYCRPEYQCPHKHSCEYALLREKAKYAQVIIINHFLINAFSNSFDGCLIIDDCQHLEKALKQEVEFTKDDFEEPVEPNPSAFNSQQKYNKALEEYLIHLEKFQLIQQLEIKEPGTYPVEIPLQLDNPSKIIFISATLPDVFPVEIQDSYIISDKRNWERIKVTVKNVNYKQNNYFNVLSNQIQYALRHYPKVIILSTSFDQLKLIEQKFPTIQTQLKHSPFQLAQMLKNGQVQAIAGCNAMWTGIDVPGEKCIIMTKLPFPNLDKETEFTKSVSKMVTTLKQGFGRMMRSPDCKGEIILLDNRIYSYPDVIGILNELKSKNATVNIEVPEPTAHSNKVVPLAVKKVS